MKNKNILTAVIALVAALIVGFFGGNALLGDNDDDTSGISSSSVNEADEIVSPTEESQDEVSSEEAISEAEDDSPDEDITSAQEENQAEYVQYYFASQKLLDSHFEKHGSEFGDLYATAEEYEKGASDVINNPDALHKTEQEDGDDVYYLEETNEFVILSTSGFIRTYFKPSAGKSYYDRQ
jgi:pyocin large subunit-like protein